MTTVDRFRSAVRARGIRVGIVGFGYVGSCIGAVLLTRGVSVLAVDSDGDRVDSVSRGTIPFCEPGLADAIADGHRAGLLESTTDLSALNGVDVILICVGTPLTGGFEPDTTQVEIVARALGPYLKPGQIVILKSTAPPGTTEQVFLPALRESADGDLELHVAFCPERLAEGSALKELGSIPVVVGALDELSGQLVSTFWEEALGVPTVAVRGPRTAEMVKLADNQWIDLNIALANEIAMLSDRIGVDALEVIEAANSLPKGRHHVNILRPSMGVGGSCLTKDPWFVQYLGRKHGLELRLPGAGRAVNDGMPSYTVERIRTGLAAMGLTPDGARIAVLGLAFKSDTGDCRNTPVKAVIDQLRSDGAELAVHDPLVSDDDARRVGGQAPTANLTDAVRGADCVAFLAGHEEFLQLTPERLADLAPGALVLDGRMYFSREAIDQMNDLGLTVRGIGR